MGLDAERLAVVPLADDDGRTVAAAGDAALVGAKAANLARAHAAGLPVLPGFALVPADRADRAAPGLPTGAEPLRRAWRRLSESHGALVVRSSAAGEDTQTSAMAGRFLSVLDVRGWEAFIAAVRRVQGSGEAMDAAVAVLVQPMLRAAAGGVMFGADPVAGRRDRILVSAVRGGPDRLVGGGAQGVRYQLTRLGRPLHTDPPEPRHARVLTRRRLARLARLARQAERIFGAPQDIEFGFDDADRLWLFQSRPITAMAAPAPRGARLLGPGPVAETFPGVLQPLEEELWLVPMAHGLTRALDIAGSAPRRLLRAVPPVTTVGGRAVADLRLLGAVPAAHPVLNALNPLPGSRRTSAAWRVGRLRAALPLLAADLIAEVDRELAGLPPPGVLRSGQLLAALSWGREVLSSLHAQESLAGALLRSPAGGTTAAGEALAVLAGERRAGPAVDEDEEEEEDEARLVARHPVLLALLPPTLGALGERPTLPKRTGRTDAPRGVAALPPREGLRLRIRWVQEMQASAVREYAARLAAAGQRGALRRLAALSWPELAAALEGGGGEPKGGFGRREPRPETPPLPAAFRLAEDGSLVAERLGRGAPDGGQGAGGGYATGTAWHGGGDDGDDGERPGDAVLVVRALDPGLAPALPGLTGLVSETGSVLSHLAILAREHRIATVVGVPDALERFPDGAEVAVDGSTGAVELVERVEPAE